MNTAQMQTVCWAALALSYGLMYLDLLAPLQVVLAVLVVALGTRILLRLLSDAWAAIRG